MRDRKDMNDERELIESSLSTARSVLEVIGFAPAEARRQAFRFRRHNLRLFEKMHPHYRDRSRLIAVVKEGRQQFEEQMAQERAEQEQRRREQPGRPQGWGEPLP